jgi:sulfur carrier protein
MQISINSNLTEIQDSTAVSELVHHVLQLNPAGMAIAINDTIVPRHLWEETLLQESDKVLVIKACSGG